MSWDRQHGWVECGTPSGVLQLLTRTETCADGSMQVCKHAHSAALCGVTRQCFQLGHVQLSTCTNASSAVVRG
jgi:hypothetical protein